MNSSLSEFSVSDVKKVVILSTTSSLLNSTEFDLDGFLESHLGSRSRDLLGSLSLTIVYGVIFVTGLLGNACTCVVIATTGYLHTATNFYLFSLAVSDLLTLIIGAYLPRGIFFCVHVCIVFVQP